MAMANAQKQQFQDRLGRIRNGGPNTLGQLYCGVNEGPAKAKDMKLKGSGKARAKSMMRELIVLPMALAVGAGALLTGRIGSFHFLQEDSVAVEYLGAAAGFLTGPLGPVALGAVLTMLLAMSFKLTQGLRAVALIVGFCAVLFGETAMLEEQPDIWAALYSSDYVQQKLTEGQLAQN